jgi:hypothetical protein
MKVQYAIKTCSKPLSVCCVELWLNNWLYVRTPNATASCLPLVSKVSWWWQYNMTHSIKRNLNISWNTIWYVVAPFWIWSNNSRLTHHVKLPHMSRYPAANSILVCDNAQIHWGPQVQQLSTGERRGHSPGSAIA